MSKERIIEIFRNNVRGRCSDTSKSNIKHDGKGGHWLEAQFGLMANANNEPDLYGYELKNQTSTKTTFGDWSANEYVFNNPLYEYLFIKGSNDKMLDKRNVFLSIFGKYNEIKNRFSWSGQPVPKISGYNDFGQKLKITSSKDVLALYNFNKDKRLNKNDIIPKPLQLENLVIAKWYGEEVPENSKGISLKTKLENKFNDKGWFTCKKDSNGRYNEICFGEPINYDNWIKLVEEGIVFFDSGMYSGNPRPYSQWRASNRLWDSLIVERYK